MAQRMPSLTRGGSGMCAGEAESLDVNDVRAVWNGAITVRKTLVESDKLHHVVHFCCVFF